MFKVCVADMPRLIEGKKYLNAWVVCSTMLTKEYGLTDREVCEIVGRDLQAIFTGREYFQHLYSIDEVFRDQCTILDITPDLNVVWVSVYGIFKTKQGALKSGGIIKEREVIS